MILPYQALALKRKEKRNFLFSRFFVFFMYSSRIWQPQMEVPSLILGKQTSYESILKLCLQQTLLLRAIERLINQPTNQPTNQQTNKPTNIHDVCGISCIQSTVEKQTTSRIDRNMAATFITKEQNLSYQNSTTTNSDEDT